MEQHFLPAAGIQAVEVASRAHIAIEDAGYQPANQIPAEFAGSASSIHADAYHPQTHHGIAAITDHFYPQTRIADHELVHTGGQYYEKDAGQGLRHRLGTDDGQDGAGYNQDEIGFATSYHSYADVSSEFGYGDGESYPCDDNPTPGIYAWANNIPNEVLHEDMSYMEGESEPKHHQQQDDQRLVYQDPQGFAEDSIGIDLGGNFRGFWRPQRW